jgi:hypothetical protein
MSKVTRGGWTSCSSCICKYFSEKELAQGAMQQRRCFLFGSITLVQSMVIGPGGSIIRKICQEAEVPSY